MTKRDTTRQKKSAPSPAVTDRQRHAIEAIVSGADDSEAARVAGVSRQTVSKWKHHNADFIAALNAARRESVDGFIDRMRGLYPVAVDALRDALDAEQPPAVRLRAAEAIIKNMPSPSGETDPEAIRAKWESEHADAMREREVARFTMPFGLD